MRNWILVLISLVFVSFCILISNSLKFTFFRFLYDFLSHFLFHTLVPIHTYADRLQVCFFFKKLLLFLKKNYLMIFFKK